VKARLASASFNKLSLGYIME